MLLAKSVGLALLATLLAGCVTTETTPVGDDPLTVPLAFTLGEKASHGDALLYAGKRLVGEENSLANNMPPFMPPPPPPTCDGRNCEHIDLVVHRDLPALAIALEWEAQDESWKTSSGPGPYLGGAAVTFDARVLRDGKMVLDLDESFHYGGAGVLEPATAGSYQVEVVSAVGTSTYLLAVRPHEPTPNDVGEPVDLLPDLVAIPPDHPTFRLPIGHELGTATADTVGGCGPDETAEDQDRRCLRFAGIIGNQGPGDFLTVLEYDEAQAALTTGNGHWEQVIRRSDGTERTERIGPADYHEVHGHFHILDFVATQLHTYDLDMQTRGEPVGDGRKMGFCIIDGGIIDLYGPLMPPQFHGSGCCYIIGICQLDMATHDRFSMGMSPNWYDIYPWWRSDQYVEVTGIPDGVYELVTVINPDGLIHEANPDNNEASTILRITGDQVEVIEMRTQAHLGPHPDADWGYARQQQDASGDEA